MLETVTLFTGQIWYVDAQNIYHHGPLYIVYIAFYCYIIWCRGCRPSGATSRAAA